MNLALEALVFTLNVTGCLAGWRIARRKRDGWILGLAATLLGAVVNAELHLISGLAFNAVGLVVNVRGWKDHHRAAIATPTA